jgi:hypothetical protein
VVVPPLELQRLVWHEHVPNAGLMQDQDAAGKEARSTAHLAASLLLCMSSCGHHPVAALAGWLHCPPQGWLRSASGRQNHLRIHMK